MTDLSELKLFATQAHPCSYLADEQATTIFIDPEVELDIDLYSQLSHYGFRRSGNHIYRPHCASCQACIPIRVDVNDFSPSRSQKRCLKRNADLQIVVTPSIGTEEHYTLYEDYIAQRHDDGDMYPANKEQFHDFLQSIAGCTHYLEIRLADRLIGLVVSDQLHDGLSAIYTYFDANYSNRSLGVFGILTQITRAKALGLNYVYLGYWIKDCRKMRYKSDYHPFQVLINNQWIAIK